ncbi:MAG TPA: tetratricopeptide repeat protein, partial [Edaphobacter sp.]|nr:tetratricopeptide repeat protein [Edaphobacter sp.]
MLYSPERSSLAGTAPAGSVLSRKIFFRIIFPAGVQHSGKRHTFYRVKDENGSSMRRGYRSIGRLSAFLPRALALLHPRAFALLHARALALLLLCCLAAFGSSAAHAQSAKTWDQRGQAAEAHHDFDTAFEDYRHATQLKPNDLRYKAHFDRTRFLAAAAHVDQGRVLVQNGDLAGAEAQFNRALQIDPGYQAAQQELDQLHKQISATPPSGPPAPTEQMSRQNEVLASIGSIAGPVELKPLSNDPIPAIHMVEDVKVIYQAIGKAAGFNVLFDPDYTSKRI